MTKKQQIMLARILISAVMLVVLVFIPADGTVRLLLYLVPYFTIGFDILINAVYGITNGRVFDENFLMVMATVGAIILGAAETGDYTEAVAVMLFYQTGELFQGYAVGRSRRNIASLMGIRPDYARVLRDGKLTKLDPGEVSVDEVIVIYPGERIPLDGIVKAGISSINTSALTGESAPRSVHEGSDVISGCINLSGELSVQVTKEYVESTVTKILELVENASSRKSHSENFISRFAAIYTPAVCISAIALAALPPVISLCIGKSVDFQIWVYRALTFLVASCPCALVVSIPLSFFAGIGGAGRRGVLVKGANYLEALSKIRCVVFDKTGTLTEGNFEVTEILCESVSKQKLLEYAAHAEYASSHPIAMSLLRAYGMEIDRGRVTDISEVSGQGVTAIVDGVKVCVGSRTLMEAQGIKPSSVNEAGTTVHISIDNNYIGSVIVSDVTKESSKDAILNLGRVGIKKTVMLTGDSSATAEKVARQLGIDTAYAELLPADKVTKLEEVLCEGSGKVAFVGDGINDAPVLTRADIGVAMGALGSDSAIEAADVVLMDDDPMKLVTAIKISKRCMAVVYQNIFFALSVKLFALILVALGMANMWGAVFADVGVMVLCVLNATRTLITK